MADTQLRLDKFLWFARFVKKREQAQEIAEAGHLRINGRVVHRAHAPVRVGNVLSFAAHGRVRVVRVEALPPHRTSPESAASCYSELAES
jgi:ribosome-associated heat shock protein Hsp15